MPLKNRDIVHPEAIKLIQEMQASKLPAVAAFKIGQNLKSLQGVLDEFNKQRQVLVDKYTKKIDDKPVHPKNADGTENKDAIELTDPEAFSKEVDALLDIDITATCPILTVKVTELGSFEIEPGRIGFLSWMLSL